ncbi:hypothetical protein XA68_17409 [Ophiocordyceps unilateralis]|uniref:G domain-containing protein n=1 Tax=Ophiocordyceps unilateralis TaxID=268505 RepID=A0A2A9PKK9_OPHUN|nr:hypothetical protein XA68_17409 [Ophiocordyceps unilateralis]
MRRATTAPWLNRAHRVGGEVTHPRPAIFLYATIRPFHAESQLSSPIKQRKRARRLTHEHKSAAEEDIRQPNKLPVTCSGCGALTHSFNPEWLGYYNPEAKRVRFWLKRHGGNSEKIDHGIPSTAAWQDVQDVVKESNKVDHVEEGTNHTEAMVPEYVKREMERKTKRSSKLRADNLVSQVLKSSKLGEDMLAKLGLTPATMLSRDEVQATIEAGYGSNRPPVCDRCSDVINYGLSRISAKPPAPYPSIDSLADTIAESPYKHNHIYHVIDAADFPMSLIPRLDVLIDGVHMRSRNRRAKTDKYVDGRQTTMNFIITRSDLLAPKKPMVDAMMPYLQQVLRDALGQFGESVRLGNVMCVSPMAGWWTDVLREKIWDNDGASWLVGKVNVGKSKLFQEIFPKGRNFKPVQRQKERISIDYDEPPLGELLPPLQPARYWPEMPVVSPLRGVTVSPIRIAYGRAGKKVRGELIDMPGLARGDLETFVKDEYKKHMFMQKRVVATQTSVTSKRSLLLGGGLIRITPRTPDLTFLMYNFTPIKHHLTSEEKAAELQSQTRESPGLERWTIPGVGDRMKHAGTFKLIYDVTKKRAGPLTRKDAVGLRVDRLPFRVLSIDILIEGVGYVEVVAQVRARDYERYPDLDGKKDQEEAQQTFSGTVSGDAGASSDPSADLEKLRLGPSTTSKWSPVCRNGLLTETDFEHRLAYEMKDEPRPVSMPEIMIEAQFEPTTDWPAVDVYSPEGRFIGIRRPIQGWENNKPMSVLRPTPPRPRRSMRGFELRHKIHNPRPMNM